VVNVPRLHRGNQKEGSGRKVTRKEIRDIICNKINQKKKKNRRLAEEKRMTGEKRQKGRNAKHDASGRANNREKASLENFEGDTAMRQKDYYQKKKKHSSRNC